MIVSKLSERLSKNLKDAKAVWVATGMISDRGFRLLESLIPESASRNFLIGVDLPTSVTVLKEILYNSVPDIYTARISKPELGIFHPKLYLIKSASGYIAYVGSANLTDGGLNTNTELSVEITDQTECIALLEWFKVLYQNAYPLTKENISIYEAFLESNPALIRSTVDLRLQKTKLDVPLFHDVDFNTRFFKKEDHLAFRRDNWKDKGPLANTERFNASKQFFKLHELIFPRFNSFGLKGLYPNRKNHIVSMTYHHGNTQKNIDAMWLSYGKSPEEIKEYHTYFPKTGADDENDLQSFINHSRLQIRIELTEIGIWILFGKNNHGSMFDRDYFLKRMKTDNKYKNDFFNLIKDLPDQYWISVNGITKDINEFENSESLHLFCKQDDPENYFIIGRDYKITDEEMSETLLPDTTLTEFRRLLPLYNLMRHRF